MIKDRISEEEYSQLLDEFSQLCLETKTPAVFGRWDLTVQDKAGRIADHRNFSSQSWTRNYYNARAVEFLSIVAMDASITANTIAFNETATPDTITDSGSGFLAGGFKAADVITVTNSNFNDGDYTIVSVAAGTLTFGDGVLAADEGAGANVTIIAANPAQFGSGRMNFLTVTNVLRQITATGGQVFIATATDDTSGVLLGSSSKAEDFDDPTFGAQISHGQAAGELYHYGTGNDESLINIVWDSDARKFTRDYKRAFLNDSGGNVTVREIGLATASGFADGDWMMARDVLDADLIVPDLYILIAAYRLESVVFPP